MYNTNCNHCGNFISSAMMQFTHYPHVDCGKREKKTGKEEHFDGKLKTKEKLET